MQQTNTLKNRLSLFLKYLGVSQAKFAEKTGLSKGFANNVGDSIRVEKLKMITNVYPELNINWLKTGEGEMLIKGADAREPFNNNKAMEKDENLTLKELMYSFKEIAESVKLNAVANERQSRNVESLIEMIREERKKGDQSVDQSGKEDSAHAV